jgi:hypothetical protein
MVVKENLENLIPKLQPAAEQLPTANVERRPETAPLEKISEKPGAPALVQAPAASLNPVQTTATLTKDPLEAKIEDVLEAGLAEAYLKLSAADKQEFKTVGEQTAKKITVLLRQTHIKIKEIFLLIIHWLKVIPGVNKFFLEQEAKIKTDKIIKIKNNF